MNVDLALVVANVGILDIKSDILSFVAQQAIAHGAIIFATLTAAFTFAVGFKDKLQNAKWWVIELYFTFLLGLFFVTCYAVIRLYIYGKYMNLVLNPPRDSTLTQTYTDLAIYWHAISQYIQNTTSQTPRLFQLVGGLSKGLVVYSLAFGIVAAFLILVLAEPPMSWRELWKTILIIVPVVALAAFVVFVLSASLF